VRDHHSLGTNYKRYVPFMDVPVVSGATAAFGVVVLVLVATVAFAAFQKGKRSRPHGVSRHPVRPVWRPCPRTTEKKNDTGNVGFAWGGGGREG
jgi:hypothetical protein